MADDTTPSWLMGALAAPDSYDTSPQWPQVAPPPPPDPRVSPIANPYAPSDASPEMGKVAFDLAVPQSPLDYALLAAGPIGRGFGKLAKMGALAAGVYGDLTDEAEAGKLGAVRKAAGALFDTSKLAEVPAVKQFDLPRYDPPRGVPQRVQDLIANPDVRQKMLDTIMKGTEQGGAGWYNAEPLRLAFTEELGKKAGNPAFQQYMDFVAATSPRSDVPTNVRNASYYYTLARQGAPMPEIGTANPAPYGHLAQRLHQQNALAVAGEGWDPLQNPKPASFAQNLAGNQAPVTVDTHAFRLPAILSQDPRFLATNYQLGKGVPARNILKEVQSGKLPFEDTLNTPAFWETQPKANEYAAMEQYYKGLGRDLGLTPAQTQASAWVGGGPVTGLASASDKAFVDFVNDRAVKTAEARGISPAEALSRMIRGKEALLAAPPVTLGALAAQDNYQPQ